MKQSLGNKIESKLSKYAIKNLSLYMLICFAIGYIIDILPGGENILRYLMLEPSLILKGQVWRLFTWVINVPDKSNLFFVLISLYFYYSIGRTLENVWGDYRYNVYIFSGMFYTILGAFVVFGVFASLNLGFIPIGDYFSTYYVCMSIFLAFAATFPEMEVMLMFILPVKVKYLGIIYGVIMISQCFEAVKYYGLLGLLFIGVPMISSLLNFFIFFITGRKRVRLTRVQRQQRKEFNTRVQMVSRQITRHKCAICGKTDESHPDTEFRFCSKCNGNYEYCQDHLFTHKHFE